MGFKLRHGLDEIVECLGSVDDVEYDVLEKQDELRYTLGPVYLPDTIDTQNEFTDSDELRKMVWEYVATGDRTLRRQHTDQVVGEIKELYQLPFEQELDMTVNNRVRKYRLPAGTVYAGVQWNESAWPDVKSGKISGFSMGGRTARIRNAADSSALKKVEFE